MIDVVDVYSQWIKDPVLFVECNFGVTPDPAQDKLLRALVDNRQLCAKASKGTGKSAWLAWSAWWCLATRPHCRIKATSITERNLQDNLWSEMSLWQKKSELLRKKYTWSRTRIVSNEHPEDWWMSAAAWPRRADQRQLEETMAGLHADYTMAILDESSGIPEAVANTAEASLSTGIENWVLQAGNPTRLSGPLYRACTRDRKNWFVVEITGDPDSPDRSPRVSKEWARKQIERWGRNNPWVKVDVFGEFPPASIDSLLGVEEVEEAMRRRPDWDDFHMAQKRIGVDVARFGDDRTVIFPRQGLVAYRPAEMRNARTNEIASRVIAAKTSWDSDLEFVDDTGGYGAGVIDSMLQSGQHPIAVNFSGKADDQRFLNKRAEMWWRMAEWIKRGGALPNIPELVQELSEPTYTTIAGRLQIEEKGQIKARLGYSPDIADALCLTFALDEASGKSGPQTYPGRGRGKGVSEWDPLADERTKHLEEDLGWES